MIKNIAIGLGAVIAVLVGIIAIQPSDYHIERSVEIAAPNDTIWNEVADFKQWKAWNPWDKEDPEQSTTIEGEAGTVGHLSSWAGEKTGKGTMTISEITAPSKIGIHLDFEEPMSGQAESGFTFTKAEGSEATTVTWYMDGKNDFMGKAFGLMMDMDSMIGGKYEEGLASLKTIAEEKAKQAQEKVVAEANTAAQAETAAEATE